MEVEAVDEGVVVVVEIVTDKEAEDEVNNNKYSKQILPNTIGHTVLVVISVISTKILKKDITTFAMTLDGFTYNCPE